MRVRLPLAWTPDGDPLPRVGSLDDVVPLVAAGDVVVLSGAGLSTESGIPDYRGPSGSLRRVNPVTYGEFVGSEEYRRRYWARSHVGRPLMARVTPNAGHHAVAALTARGVVTSVITQNVDGLHQAAGTLDVIELHGGLDRVVCLSCRASSSRALLDTRLREANPTFAAVAGHVNPDGDVELPDAVVATFRVVDCLDCGAGPLKPDVVFFGENVPPARVQRCYDLVGSAKALLVLGSSLTVMSGLRFVRRAAEQDIPVAIITHGPTRGDAYATFRIDRPLGTALTELVSRLG